MAKEKEGTYIVAVMIGAAVEVPPTIFIVVVTVRVIVVIALLIQISDVTLPVAPPNIVCCYNRHEAAKPLRSAAAIILKTPDPG